MKNGRMTIPSIGAGGMEGIMTGSTHQPLIFSLMRLLVSYVALAGAFLFICAGCSGGGGGDSGDPPGDIDIVDIEEADVYCIDIYEASRPDASAGSAGSDDAMAMSREGVVPWKVWDNNATADDACKAAGKRLCTPEEWEYACRGPGDTVYAYGDDYEPQTCNGLETFEQEGFHLAPTGSLTECTNGFGVFDMSGNLWEHTSNGDGMTVRGGAYNCYYPETRLRCGYIPGDWVPTALGFRCCKNCESGECPEDMVKIIPE